MRYVVTALLAALVLGGCTTKEISQGVDSGISDVKRVIRGNN